MDIVFLLCVGLVAGLLGGLLGIGGSVIMIPAMLFFIPDMTIHLAQAIAMTVNPAVAISATSMHHRNNTVSWFAVKRVIPISIFFICFAAWLSNKIEGDWLELAFGIFLIWVLWDQISYFIGVVSENDRTPTSSNFRFSLTGGATGAVSGLLGIGGGLIRVPLLNTFCRIPMKRAIGTSSAIMFVTAIFGATIKDISLPNAVNDVGEPSGLTAYDALYGSLWIVPGAIVGGWFGAKLMNVLPVKLIRCVFGVLITIASYEMITSASESLF